MGQRIDAAISEMNKAVGATKKFLVGNPAQTGVTPAPKLPEGALGKPTVVDLTPPANTTIKPTTIPASVNAPAPTATTATATPSATGPKYTRPSMQADLFPEGQKYDYNGVKNTTVNNAATNSGGARPSINPNQMEMNLPQGNTATGKIQQPIELQGAAERAGQRMGPMDSVTAAERVKNATVPEKPSIASKVLNYVRDAQVSPEGEGFLKVAGKKALNTAGAVGGGVTAYNAGKDIANNGLKFDSFENSVKSANNLFDIGTGAAMAGGSAAAATGIGAIPGATAATLGGVGQTAKTIGEGLVWGVDKLPRIFGARDFSQQIAGVDNRKEGPTKEEIAALKAKADAAMPAAAPASNVVVPTGTPEQMAEKARSDRFYKTGSAQDELASMIPASGRNMVESGNNGLRTLATNPDAMNKFNEVQGLRDNGIRGEVDANGRVSLTGYKPTGYQSEGEKARIADNIAKGNTLDANGNYQSAATKQFIKDAHENALDTQAYQQGFSKDQRMEAAKTRAAARISEDTAATAAANTAFEHEHILRNEAANAATAAATAKQRDIDNKRADTAAQEKQRNDDLNVVNADLKQKFAKDDARGQEFAQAVQAAGGKSYAELLRTPANPATGEKSGAEQLQDFYANFMAGKNTYDANDKAGSTGIAGEFKDGGTAGVTDVIFRHGVGAQDYGDPMLFGGVDGSVGISLRNASKDAAGIPSASIRQRISDKVYRKSK